MHYYNTGAVFEAAMEIFKPLLSKKLRERVIDIFFHVFACRDTGKWIHLLVFDLMSNKISVN